MATGIQTLDVVHADPRQPLLQQRPVRKTRQAVVKREVLDPFIDDMTQQVSRSLQFYLASGSGRSQPDQILICGGCANIPGVAEVISSRVGVPADKGDPLGNMKVSSKAKAQAVARDATALLTACGLALRSFD